MDNVEKLKPPRSAAAQFLNRPEEDEDEVWNKPWRQTWRNARPRSREDIMLDCRFSGGNRQAFGYAYLGSIVYAGDTITLLFAETAVRIQGRNLDRVYTALCQHRVPFIQEGNDAEEELKPDDECHIERIEVMNGTDEADG